MLLNAEIQGAQDMLFYEKALSELTGQAIPVVMWI